MDIRLTKPAAGATQSVASAPDGRFVFDFPSDQAVLSRSGDHLVLTFEDGSALRLENFYTTYSKDEMPTFNIEGMDIDGKDFFAAMNASDIMPAAGPSAGSAAARGGRYNEYDGPGLLDGIDRLGGLDIGFPRERVEEDDWAAYGRHDDEGMELAAVTVPGTEAGQQPSPEPQPQPEDRPEPSPEPSPAPQPQPEPGNTGPEILGGAGGDVIESGVRTENMVIQNNVAHAGVPSFTGQIVAQDADGDILHYVFADGSSSQSTGYGTITLDPLTGQFVYTLDNSRADSLPLGSKVVENFEIVVTDGRGGEARTTVSITVIGTNDQPTISAPVADNDRFLVYEAGVGRDNDTNKVVENGTDDEENAAYDYTGKGQGNTVTGRVQGHDVDAGASLTYGAAAGAGSAKPDASAFTDANNGQTTVQGQFGTLTLQANGTWTYTLTDDQEATPGRPFVASDGKTYASLDSLSEGVTVDETFTLYVKDEHGAWNSTTLTLTVTGTNDRPVFAANETEIFLDAAGREVAGADSLIAPGTASDNKVTSVTGRVVASDADLENGAGQATNTDTTHQNFGLVFSLQDPGAQGSEGGVYTVEGTYGTLTLKPDGTYTYELLDNAACQTLPKGEERTETFTVRVTDERGAWDEKEISFIIKGSNDRPTISAPVADDGSFVVYEAGVGRDNDTNEVVVNGEPELENKAYDYSGKGQGNTVTGRVQGHDVDAGASLTYGAAAGTGQGSPADSVFTDANNGQTTVQGQFGTLTLQANGTWTYTLAAADEQGTTPGQSFKANDDNWYTSLDHLSEGVTVDETFTLYVKDEHGAWSSTTLTVTVTGTNDRPELSIDQATHTLTPDQAEKGGAGSWATVEGKFTIADADADAGTYQTIRIEGGSTSTSDEKYTTTPKEGSSAVEGLITGNSETSQAATYTTDYGTLTLKPDGSWSYVVDAGSDKVQALDSTNPWVETFVVTVVDEHGATDRQTITITIKGADEAPVITSVDSLDFKEQGVYGTTDPNTPTTVGGTEDGEHTATSLTGKVQYDDVDTADQGKLTLGISFSSSTLTGRKNPEQLGEPVRTDNEDGTITFTSDYGTLVFNTSNGSYSYTLNLDGEGYQSSSAVNHLAQGETLTEIFTVTVTDTTKLTAEQTITITIHGTNDLPWVEKADNLSVTESGVGRDSQGKVIDKPGDSAENTGYAGVPTGDGKILGKDADYGASLTYGVQVKGEGDSKPNPEAAKFAEGAEAVAEGKYGTLTLDKDGSYSYAMKGENDPVSFEIDGRQYESLNQLNEGEELTETFTLYVKDEHGAWASKDVTITITGTNDQPKFETNEPETFRDADGKVVTVSDNALVLRGTAAAEGEQSVTSVSGRVVASDADLENGADQATNTDASGKNFGLVFSLQGPDAQRGADGTYTVTTDYGTLTFNPDGSYTYALDADSKAVEALGVGEKHTEKFTVRVTDDRGAWDDKELTFTIKGSNDKAVVEPNSQSEITVVETGVWGDQDPSKNPDAVRDDGKSSYGNTVTFDKVDTNDTHSLVLKSDFALEGSLDVTAPEDWSEGVDVSGAYALAPVAGKEGQYTLTATIPGVKDGKPITLGTLVLEQNGTDSDLTYTFTPNETSAGLNNLPQGMEFSIALPLQVKDQHNALSDDTHTATITIVGTNDRPTISFEKGSGGKASLVAEGVGVGVTTKDALTLNPDENEFSPASGPIKGQLVGTDPDSGDTATDFFIAKVTGTTNAKDHLTFVTSDDKNEIVISLDGQKVATLTLKEGGSYELALVQPEDGASNPLMAYEEGSSFSFKVDFNVKDSHGSTAEKTVTQTFTLTASNERPVISTRGEDGKDLLAAEIQESATNITGKLQATDADEKTLDGQADKLTFGLVPDSAVTKGADGTFTLTGETRMQSVIEMPNWGRLELDANGNYRFYLDQDSEAVRALSEGATKDLTFHVAVRDDKGAYDIQELTITVRGEDTATAFRGSANTATLVEAGVIAPEKEGGQNTPVDDVSTAHGTLTAVEYDTDDKGQRYDVVYSVKEEGAKTSSFSELEIEGGTRTEINQTFTGESAWKEDAAVTVVKGDYGTLYLNNETGQYFYELDNTSKDVQGLTQGQSVRESFSIHAQGTGENNKNGADQDLVISIVGTNDAPEVAGVTVDNQDVTVTQVEDGYTVSGITEDGSIRTVTGQITAQDVDSPDDLENDNSVLRFVLVDKDGSYRQALSGEYGDLVLNEKDGTYTFRLNNEAAQKLDAGVKGKVEFQVAVLDEYRAISEIKTLTFEVTGTNDKASIDTAYRTMTEDDNIGTERTGKLTINDTDTVFGKDNAQFFTGGSFGNDETVPMGEGGCVLVGKYGTLTLQADGSYTYQLLVFPKEANKTEEDIAELREELQAMNEAESDGRDLSVTETFTVYATSGSEKDVTGEIVVTIKGANDAPKVDYVQDSTGKTLTKGEDDTYQMDVPGWSAVTGTFQGKDIDNNPGDLRYHVDQAPLEDPNTPGTSQTYKGEYGYLTINAQDGTFSYVVDPASEAYQGLAGKEPGKDSFTLVVTDPHGESDTVEIVFNVTYKGSPDGSGSVDLDDPAPVEVAEDNGHYFKDAQGNGTDEETQAVSDNTPPPAVESEFTKLTSNDQPVTLPADRIWLVDEDGTHTHVIKKDYGSLILERNDKGEWGYRFVLDNSSEAVQSLDEDQQIPLTFQVQTSSLKDPVEIKVTVTGLNDRPVIEQVTNLKLDDTDTTAVTGAIQTTDPDKGDVGSLEDGDSKLTYSVTAKDGSTLDLKLIDGTEGSYLVVEGDKTWGTFTLNQDGTYSFTAGEEASSLLAGENKSLELTVEVDDNSGAPNSKAQETLVITIKGTNEEPKISAAPDLAVTEDTALTDTQKVSVTDDRVGEDGQPVGLSFAVSAEEDGKASPMAQGEYGSLLIHSDGTYTYQLNNQTGSVQSLGVGETKEETFWIHVKDKDGGTTKQQVTVTITGTNDNPVLSLDKPVLDISEAGNTDGEDVSYAVSGTVTASDVDRYVSEDGTESQDILTFSLQNKDGTEGTEFVTDYGTFSIDPGTGAYTFMLNPDAEAVKNLRETDVATVTTTVVVSDGKGGSSTQELVVHIQGTASEPTVTAESLAKEITEDDPAGFVSGQIEANSWDRGPDGSANPTLRYSLDGAKSEIVDGVVWHRVESEYGVLLLNTETGAYEYTPSEAVQTLAAEQKETDSFKVTVTNAGTNKATSGDIVVTITGTNDAPEITTSSLTGNTGNLAFKDVDANDTHSVTFDGFVDAQGAPLVVQLEGSSESTVDVYLKDGDGETVKAGSLDLTVGEGGKSLGYTFEPDEDYVNSLPVGEEHELKFNLIVSDDHDGTATEEGLAFTVTNANDAPVIKDASVDDNNVVTLVFEDADVRDTHSVTFNGLKDQEGKDLRVDLSGEIPASLDVYQADLQIGTLTLETKEDGSLSYRFDTKGYEDNLPVTEVGQPGSLEFSITVEDEGGETAEQTGLSFSYTNANDTPVIDDEASSVKGTAGTLVFTDADVRDTHTVTFDFTNEEIKPVTFDLSAGRTTETVLSSDGKTTLGSLILTQGDDGLHYSFKPTQAYVDSLPVDVPQELGFTVTVNDNHGGTATKSGLAFTVTNENDEPVIESASVKNNTGTLVFTDADKLDTHKVTFAFGEGIASVTFNLAADTPPQEVVSSDGETVGTLTLTQKDDGLHYSFKPDQAYVDSLPVGKATSLDFTVTVNDGNGGTASTTGSFTVTNANDAPELVDGTETSPATLAEESLAATGSFTFSDADKEDTHTISLPETMTIGEQQATITTDSSERGNSVSGTVILGDVTVGTLTATLDENTVSYTLTVNPDYMAGLEADTTATVTLTVTDKAGESLNQTVSFSLAASAPEEEPAEEETEEPVVPEEDTEEPGTEEGDPTGTTEEPGTGTNGQPNPTEDSELGTAGPTGTTEEPGTGTNGQPNPIEDSELGTAGPTGTTEEPGTGTNGQPNPTKDSELGTDDQTEPTKDSELGTDDQTEPTKDSELGTNGQPNPTKDSELGTDDQTGTTEEPGVEEGDQKENNTFETFLIEQEESDEPIFGEGVTVTPYNEDTVAYVGSKDTLDILVAEGTEEELSLEDMLKADPSTEADAPTSATSVEVLIQGSVGDLTDKAALADKGIGINAEDKSISLNNTKWSEKSLTDMPSDTSGTATEDAQPSVSTYNNSSDNLSMQVNTSVVTVSLEQQITERNISDGNA